VSASGLTHPNKKDPREERRGEERRQDERREVLPRKEEGRKEGRNGLCCVISLPCMSKKEETYLNENF